MASLKFGQVFAALMLASGASAVFVPSEVSDRLGTPLQKLFFPVSSSVHGSAGWFQAKVGANAPAKDPAAPSGEASLAEENRMLRAEVSALYSQLQTLQQLNADRAALGKFRERSVPARITGLELSARQILLATVSEAANVAPGMATISSAGLMGRVTGYSRGAVRVQLTTDPESKIQARFMRYEKRADGVLIPRRVGVEKPLVEGAGAGAMRVAISMQKVNEAGVVAGDYLVVDDLQRSPGDPRGWPADVQGFIIGSVARVEKSRSNPLMAEITVTPADDPARLREVAILNR